MESRESDLSLLSDLNSVHLKTSELLIVVKAALKVHQNRRHRRFLGTIATIKNLSGNSNKATAIIVRLQALSRMAEKDELKHWILAEETDFSPTIAHRALISAAASHPLSLSDGEFVFERESFLRTVLELAQPEGGLQ